MAAAWAGAAGSVYRDVPLLRGGLGKIAAGERIWQDVGAQRLEGVRV